MANRYLRSIISPPTHDDFLQAEPSEWAMARQLFTCRGCVQFRSFVHFSDDMRKGKCARRGLAAKTRFCIRCGVERGWYAEGIEIAILSKAVPRACARELLSRDRNQIQYSNPDLDSKILSAWPNFIRRQQP